MKNILLVTTLFLVSIASFGQQKIDYKKRGAPIPEFYINRTDGGYIIPSQLKKGKPVMIMIFSPECDHCGHMVDSLKMIRKQFKTTQLILVAEERNKKLMEGFIEHEDIKEDALFKNIGTNKGELIAAIYTNKILPQITFYDANHKLVKILDGNYTLEDVKRYVK